MAKWKIYNEDAVEWAKHYEKAKFHALLCDPPYHLTSIVKRFGKNGSAPAKYGTDGVFQRASSGFMGQTWDGGDVAFQPETWAAFAQVLHPGAFIMVFSSSRTWHRLATAIEDAGYVLHPSIFLWAQGQGFPKATRIDTQIQPKGEHKATGKTRHRNVKPYDDENGWNANNTKGDFEYTEPTDPMAIAWQGHRYGLQALKPAVEPIIVAQLPYDGKPVENMVRTGAGALNVDGGRIEYTGKTDPRTFGGEWRTDKAAKNVYEGGYVGEPQTVSAKGRWPANFILDEATAPVLDEQSGERLGFSGGGTKGAGFRKGYVNGDKQDSELPAQYFNDSGGASRFFYTVSSALDESDPVYYCAKVSSNEKESGLIGSLPCTKCGNVNSETHIETNSKGEKVEIKCRRNPHPTLKPLDLCKYLATLLLPPDNYAPRRILVPFSGSGSEMIGAGLAGWEQIVGVEFDTESGYIDIAKARLEHWLK